jgi:hypothetical protein
LVQPKVRFGLESGNLTRAFYRDIVILRTTSPDFRSKDVRVVHRNVADKVVAYERGRHVVVLNLKNVAYAIGVPGAGPWQTVLTTADRRYGTGEQSGGPERVARAAPRDGFSHTLDLALPAHGGLVLGRNGP